MRTFILNFVLISILLSAHAYASSEKSCNDLLLNQLETTVRDLAQLRFDLDLQLSQGKESIVTRALQTAFERKQTEALQSFSSTNLTGEQLKEKIQNEIKKMQGERVEIAEERKQAFMKEAAQMDDIKAQMETDWKLALPVEGASASMVLDGKILLVGGKSENDASSKTAIQIIDPETGELKHILNLKYPRENAIQWTLDDGSVLVTGGGSSQIELISADLKSVSVIGEGPEFAINSAHYGRLEDGSFLWVGYMENSFQFHFYRFVPATQEIVFLGAVGGLHPGNAISIYPDGNVVVSGGQTGSYINGVIPIVTNAIHLIKPLTMNTSWSNFLRKIDSKYGGVKIAKMESKVFNHQQTLLKDGRIVISGGEEGSDSENEVGVYDPRTRKYKKIGSLSKDRAHHVATLLHDGRVLVTGGYSDSGGGVSEVEIIDPDLETVKPVGYLAETRYGHTVSEISGDGVVIIGGRNTDSRADPRKVESMERIFFGPR